MPQNPNELRQLNRVIAGGVVGMPTTDAVHILVLLDKCEHRIPIVRLTPNDDNFFDSSGSGFRNDLIWVLKVLRILNMAVSVDQHAFE